MQLEIEREALRKEKDKASQERLARLDKELADLKEEQTRLTAHWQQEKALIQESAKLQEQLEAVKVDVERAQRTGDYQKASELQDGRVPDMERQIKVAAGPARRNAEERADAEAGGRRGRHRRSREPLDAHSREPPHGGRSPEAIHMEERLHKRLIGQDEAINAVSNAIRRARAGLQDPNRPLGSFLFLGPTGVGKTELARALAEFLFDDEQAMVRVDMSEYQESTPCRA